MSRTSVSNASRYTYVHAWDLRLNQLNHTNASCHPYKHAWICERPKATDIKEESNISMHHVTHVTYGVATISRLLKIIRLFCRISSLLYGSFAKETYNFTTNQSHPILHNIQGTHMNAPFHTYNVTHMNTPATQMNMPVTHMKIPATCHTYEHTAWWCLHQSAERASTQVTHANASCHI